MLCKSGGKIQTEMIWQKWTWSFPNLWNITRASAFCCIRELFVVAAQIYNSKMTKIMTATALLSFSQDHPQSQMLRSWYAERLPDWKSNHILSVPVPAFPRNCFIFVFLNFSQSLLAHLWHEENWSRWPLPTLTCWALLISFKPCLLIVIHLCK